MFLSVSDIRMDILEVVIHPPSSEVSFLVYRAGWILPPTTHWMDEAGLELEVSQPKEMVSLIRAVFGPVIVTLSGATKTSLR